MHRFSSFHTLECACQINWLLQKTKITFENKTAEQRFKIIYFIMLYGTRVREQHNIGTAVVNANWLD